MVLSVGNEVLSKGTYIRRIGGTHDGQSLYEGSSINGSFIIRHADNNNND